MNMSQSPFLCQFAKTGNWLPSQIPESLGEGGDWCCLNTKSVRTSVDPNVFPSPVKWIQAAFRAKHRHAHVRTYLDAELMQMIATKAGDHARLHRTHPAYPVAPECALQRCTDFFLHLRVLRSLIPSLQDPSPISVVFFILSSLREVWSAISTWLEHSLREDRRNLLSQRTTWQLGVLTVSPEVHSAWEQLTPELSLRTSRCEGEPGLSRLTSHPTQSCV